MDCKEFDRLLWDGPGDLTPPMEEHLKSCPKCRESYARYRQMFELAEQSEVDRSEAFWQNFNSVVWDKIDKTENKSAVSQIGLWQRPAMNFRRFSISAGLAIVTVTILVVLLTDLTRKAPPQLPVASENYRTFDVTLESAPKSSQELADAREPAKGDISPETLKTKDESNKEIAAVSQTEEIKSITENEARLDSSAMLGSIDAAKQFGAIRGGRAANIVPPAVSADTHSSMDVSARLRKADDMTENLMDVPRITGDTDQIISFQQFSILAEPKTDKKGDSGSVSIDAVFLTDDGLKDKQISVAQSVSAEEVVTNKPSRISLSGLKSQQTSFTEPRVISLKKMPHPKHLSTPEYPSIAYSLGKEAEVWVKAFISASGKVEQAVIYQGTDSDYGFEEEAIKAAYKNEFEPLEIDGRKMPVWIIYKVKYIRAK